MEPGAQYTYRKDFSGGHNDTVAEINVAPNEAEIAKNIEIERDGSVSKRNGALEANSTPVDGEVGMIHRHQPSGGSAELLVAHDDQIDTWNGIDTFGSLITGLTADKVVLPAPYRNLLYMMNNADNPMVYWQGKAGTPRVYRPGAPAPTTLTASAVAGTHFTSGGDVYVRARYVDVFDQTFFGDPYPAAGVKVTVAASNDIQIDSLSSYSNYAGVGDPDFIIGWIIIERTILGGDPSGPYFMDKIVTHPASPPFLLELTDDELIESDLMPDDGARQPLPKLWPFTRYKNRIVGIDPTDFGRVIWSEIDEFGLIPSLYPADYYVYLDIEDEGDLPIMVLPYGDYLIWYCGKSIHVTFIDEGGIGYSRRLGRHDLGFPSPRGGVELPEGHVVWSYKGPYFFTGQGLIYIGEKIEASIKSISKAGLGEMFAIHRTQEQRRQVKFVMPLSGVQNNLAWKYNYRRQTLSPLGFPTVHAWTYDDGFSAKSGLISLDPVSREEIEHSGNYDGQLYTEDDGDANEHDDNGIIEAEWRTRWDDMDAPQVVKDFEELWVFVTGDIPDNLIVTWQTEFGAGPDGSATLESIQPDQSLFGTAVWGESVFSFGRAKVLHTHLGLDGVTAVGRFLQLALKNSSANQPFTIMGYMVKWDVNRDRNDAVD